MKNITRAIPKALGSLFADESEARAYVKRQKDQFNGLSNSACDFAGWIALRLSCTRTEAETIVKWAGESL
jgi:hypothetical protein